MNYNTTIMTEQTKEPSEELIMSIIEILFDNGMKATTMDSVAAALSMSKRTLYEIFDSKKNMIISVVRYWHLLRQRKIEAIFKDSQTVMEALARTFKYHQQMMKNINPEFFFDMDNHFPEVRREFEDYDRKWVDKLMYVINIGIEQGVFRPDVNHQIFLHLMRIQMESLKRMEEVFPPGIKIKDAFDCISQGFLRAIATNEGLDIIDTFYEDNPKYYNTTLLESKS